MASGAAKASSANKTVVALIFGGRSSEHSISCSTASGVLSAIDTEKYSVIPIGITRDGAFTLQPADPAFFAMNPAAMPEVVDNGTRVHWPESAVTREITVTDAAGQTRSLGSVDVAFPILHGPFGEDGTMQGLLELTGLPYVGSGVLGSALGMDKHFAKTVLVAAGVAVAPWVRVTPGGWRDDNAVWREHAHSLGLPVFVKPARAGSSVGVSKVSQWSELDAALNVAFAEDSTALIETAIVGREIEVGVISGRNGGPPRVSLAGEVIVTGREFYDYDAKYLDDSAATVVCPTDLRDVELLEVQRIAARAFEAIGASGLARVDFFFTGTEFIVNELNTMPGFTPISMFPKCWEASGVSYRELIDELIQLGLEAVR
ncbi:MAG: D-alanine--D-alanine ligase [Salinibacterium sp.]|nr:D-alanine--D-alanine ligase [Salinibacterium sp.]